MNEYPRRPAYDIFIKISVTYMHSTKTYKGSAEILSEVTFQISSVI